MSSFRKRLIDCAALQLLLGLVSYLVLSAWSLPFSFFSLFLSVIMMPVLTLFLGVSMLIFLTELIGIPNQFLIFILSKLSLLLTLPTVVIPKPCFLASLAYVPYVILFALGIILCCFRRFTKKSMMWVVLAFVFVVVVRWVYAPSVRVEFLNGEHAGLILMHKGSQGVLIVTGKAKSRGSSYVGYELVPALVGRGVTCIHTLILCRPSAGAYTLALELAKALEVKAVVYSCFQGALCRTGWVARYEFFEAALQGGFSVVELEDQPYEVDFQGEVILYKPGGIIKKNGLKYRGAMISRQGVVVHDEATKKRR